MKNEPKKNLKLRLFLSLAFLIGFFTLSVYAFRSIQSGPRAAGAPRLLRSSFRFNEEVWALLRSSRKLSVAKPVPQNRSPRVNGMLGLKTPVDVTNYSVAVTRSSDESIRIPIQAILLLPKTSYSTDFRCIEGWSEETHYAGARFSEFLAAYGLGKKPDGSFYRYVGLETPDRQYYVSIDMESMLHPQTLLAYEMNLRPLSLENGAPLRLMIPIKYGIKSLKRIGRIFFSDSRPPDYWAERGYDWDSGL